MNMNKSYNPFFQTTSGSALPKLTYLVCIGILIQTLTCLPQTKSTHSSTPPNSSSSRVKGFKIVDYYPAEPGKTSIIRSIFLGDEAYPLPSRLGSVQIKGMTIELFNPEGQTNLIIKADDCFFDSLSQSAYSSNKIWGATPDNSLSITGSGFLWSSSNATIIVTNDVQTILLRKNPENTNKPQTSRKITITASSISYFINRSQVEYTTNVCVTDSEKFKLTCDTLKLWPRPEAHQLNKVEAMGNINVSFIDPQRKSHVNSQKAIMYQTNNNEIVEFHGNPTWNVNQISGSADLLELNLTKNSFLAKGHGEVKLVSTFTNLMPGNSLTTNQDNNYILLKFEHGYFEDNHLNVSSNVFIEHPGKMSMTCQNLNALLDSNSNIITSAVASNCSNINIYTAHGTVTIQGQMVELDTPTNSQRTIQVKGQPSWQMNNYSGTANTLSLDLVSDKFLAQGNSTVNLSFHQNSKCNTTNILNSNSNIYTIIVKSDKAELSEGTGAFIGNVIASQQDWDIKCQIISFVFNPTNKTFSKIIALDGVTMNYHLTRPKPNFSNNSPKPTNATSAPNLSNISKKFFNGSDNWVLTANQLILETDAQNQPITITAEKNVQWSQSDTIATGEKLIFKIPESTAELIQTKKIINQKGLTLTGSDNCRVTIATDSGKINIIGDYKLKVLPQLINSK